MSTEKHVRDLEDSILDGPEEQALPVEVPDIPNLVETIRPDNKVPERMPTQTAVENGYLPRDAHGRVYQPAKRAPGRYDHRKRR